MDLARPIVGALSDLDDLEPVIVADRAGRDAERVVGAPIERKYHAQPVVVLLPERDAMSVPMFPASL